MDNRHQEEENRMEEIDLDNRLLEEGNRHREVEIDLDNRPYSQILSVIIIGR